MKKNRYIPIFIIFFLFYQFIFANINADSLFFSIKKKKPEEKLQILIDFIDNNISDSPEQIKSIAQRTLELSQKYRLKKSESDALTCLAIIEKNLGNYQKAEKYYNEALEISEKINNLNLKAYILNNKGILFDLKGDYNTAIEIYNQSLNIYLRLENIEMKYSLYNNIGGSYRRLGNFAKALEYSLQSLEYDEKYGEGKSLATSYDNIGIIYYYLEDAEKALDSFNKSLEIRQKINDKKGIAASYNNISIIYRKTGEVEKILEILQKSISIKKEIGDQLGMANSMMNLGNYYFSIDNKKEAEKCFKKSLIIKRELGNHRNIVKALIGLGNIYTERNDYETFLKYYDECLKLAQENDSGDLLKHIYKDLAINYATFNKFKKAYDIKSKHISLVDSLNSEKNQTKIAELRVQYETEKKERMIGLLQNENEKQDLIRNFLIVIMVIVFLGTILLIKLIIDKKKEIVQRKSIEKQIREINKSLENRVQTEFEKRQQHQLLLIQKSKLESLGRLSAGIVHEVNQPITRISLGLDNILIRKTMNKLDENYMMKKFNSLFCEIERIKEIMEHIRLFSRHQNQNADEKLDVNQIIKNTTKLLQTQYKNHNIILDFDLTENLPSISGNKFRLEQILMNLLSNAKDAVEERFMIDENIDKKIILRSYLKSENVILEIEDYGIGIDEVNLNHIFDPFFTTKDSDKGTGLGLSIVQGIIEEMNGKIEVESEKGKFTKVKIVFKAEKY
ncbi:MAG: tetratricopeptide repeat protein [Candidatus Cloacimonetes bacterium]|nr:tetratricopeptide repeat protein [Candidatus Cloacimonadota bacterium]